MEYPAQCHPDSTGKIHSSLEEAADANTALQLQFSFAEKPARKTPAKAATKKSRKKH